MAAQIRAGQRRVTQLLGQPITVHVQDGVIVVTGQAGPLIVTEAFGHVWACPGTPAHPLFPIPEALIGDGGTLVGTDGQAKMSKSIGNCIYLSDDAATVEKKVKSMYTDPTRIRPTDPGHVEGNPVFIYHDYFNH